MSNDPVIEELQHLEDEFDIKEAEIIEVEPEEKAIIELEPGEIIEHIEEDEESYSNELREKRKEDYEYARVNIKAAIEVGAEALEDIARIAQSSEHPRAFEVLSTLLKSVVDSNEKLIDMNKKVDESEADVGIKVVEKEESKVQNQQNNFFIGSTAQLQEFLQNQQEKIVDGKSEKDEEED